MDNPNLRRNNAVSVHEFKAKHCESHWKCERRNKQVSAEMKHILVLSSFAMTPATSKRLQRNGTSPVFLQHEITAHPLLLDSNEA